MILYTLYKNSYIDIAHLESTKGITCYVNSTNRCTCSCTFCLRQTKEMIENNSLWLKEEPTVDEIIQEFEKYNLNDFKEVVFCGFGEPLIRHDDLMKVAKYLNKRDITPEFKGLLDTVSISLNTSNKEDYLKLTRSQYGIDSFDELLDFAKKCKAYVPHVVLTIVDTTIPEKDVEICKQIAQNIGVTLRIRPFED